MDATSHVKTALNSMGYVMGDKISAGSFAVVRSVIVKGSGDPLAAKIIDRSKAPKDFLNKFLPKELAIMKVIEHDNIIKFNDIIQVGWYTIIMMEKAEGGDLLTMISTFGSMSEVDCKPLFVQLVKGLLYLHDKTIAHRDIKCENILFDKNMVIKLADFGFARYCVNPQTKARELSETYCGSAAYAAPEVLKGFPYNPLMADVWSLGVVAYIMICGIMPFDDTDHGRLLRNQMERRWTWHPDKRGLLSVSLRRMIKSMLEPDITLRQTLRRLTFADWIRLYFTEEEAETPTAAAATTSKPDQDPTKKRRLTIQDILPGNRPPRSR